MGSRLLVEFYADRYAEHMQRWASWQLQISEGGEPALGFKGGLPDKLGFYTGGPERATRKKPYTARGKQTERRAPRSHYPEGYATEEYIDKAVAELRQQNPGQAAAVEEQYLRRGPRSEKAARLGITLADFKARTTAARLFICGFMSALRA